MPLLEVTELAVYLPHAAEQRLVVDHVSFELYPGETLAITGPSGSGKTATLLALTGLRPDGGPALIDGSIRLEGQELVGSGVESWRSVRGRRIALIPQDAGASLTPVRRVGDLISEVVQVNSEQPQSAPEQEAKTLDLLAEVGFSDPASTFRLYPHELSGGMRQRIAIAAALAGGPSLLLADEPTASLDVIAARETMELLGSIQRDRSMATLLVSHDQKVLADRADRVLYLRDGRLGLGSSKRQPKRHLPADESRDAQLAGYSAGSPAGVRAKPVLELQGVGKTFKSKGPGSEHFVALQDASFVIYPGDSLGLVGPTGSGKSTLARCAARLIEPTTGSVSVEGQEITHFPLRKVRKIRTSIGMVFQNPAASLNPKRRVQSAIESPLRARRVGPPEERARLVAEAAASARVDPELLERFPGELSGGQQQRVALARALVHNPSLLILDEPFSALDAENESALIELLGGLRIKRDLSLLLITHDMSVVERLTDHVVVIEKGKIVESGGTEEVVANPQERITRELMVAGGVART